MNTPIPMQERKIREAAIIVASPFQALCAMEAIKSFQVEKPHFYAYESENSLEKTHSFIISRGYECEDLKDVSGTFSIINAFKKHKKYNCIISGDYFSKFCFLIALLWSKVKTDIIYVDDGNSTLTLLPPLRKKRFKEGSTLQILFYGILLLFSKIKGLTHTFFTIYNVEGKEFPYPSFKNSFSGLCSGSDKHKTGVYIIGTNSSKTGWERQVYCDYLAIVKHYVDENYPKEKVYYCPHRSDQYNYDKECENLGMAMFNTKVSVEVDFVTNNINPVAVFGFGSTALLTLKLIFGDSNVIDIVYHSDNRQEELEYRQIERIYEQNGISLLDIAI